MKKVRQYDFCDIFHFALEKYGIHWNPCNDIFFGNAFEYRTVTDYYIEDFKGCTDLWDKEDTKEKASDYTKEEVLAMSKSDQSYLITSAYFESIGVSGEVQIDSR